VCMSSGNAEGLGDIRKSELVSSCKLLGIPSAETAVTVLEHPSLPDSMTTMWPVDVISSLLSESLKEAREQPNEGSDTIDTILTFDSQGISSHPNHISLLAGAKYFIQQNSAQRNSNPHDDKNGKNKDILLYTLTSVPIYRKYISVLDILPTAFIHRQTGIEFGGTAGAPKSVVYVSGWDEYRTAQRAMVEGHKSQMVWFRWGWISLSRYMVTNDLVLGEV